jgi:uncharacterized Zn finger protein (UPF0148 family)
MDKRDFCPFCEREVDFIITREESMFADVGETDVYTCPKCGEAFEIAEIDDTRLQALNDHYNDRKRKWEARNGED